MSGQRHDGRNRRSPHFRRFGFVKQRLNFRVKRSAQPGVTKQRNRQQQIGQLRRLGRRLRPRLVRGAVRRDQGGVADLTAQSQLSAGGNLREGAAFGAKLDGFGLQQNGGEIAHRLLEDVGRDAVAAVEAAAAELERRLGDVRVTPRFPTPLQRTLSS